MPSAPPQRNVKLQVMLLLHGWSHHHGVYSCYSKNGSFCYHWYHKHMRVFPVSLLLTQRSAHHQYSPFCTPNSRSRDVRAVALICKLQLPESK